MRFTFEIFDAGAMALFEGAQSFLQRFGATHLVEKAAGDGRIDGLLTIYHSAQHRTRFVCEARQQIHSQNLALIISRLKDLASEVGMKPLLITQYVNANLADELRAKDVGYIDGVGNMLLADLPLHIWIQRFKPREKSSRVARAFQSTGLRLIAFLLAKPEAIGWSYRKLAGHGGLSLGSASRIAGDLRNMGYIRLVGPNKNALVNRQDLFEHWEFNYATRLRPSLKPQTFRLDGTADIELIAKRIPAGMREEVLIGGELAAAIATGHLRPQSATLHVRADRPVLPLVKALGLIPERNGNVTILEQLAEPAEWRWEGFEAENLIHPLLVHAELLQGQSDDRLRETARLILEKHLLRLFNNET